MRVFSPFTAFLLIAPLLISLPAPAAAFECPRFKKPTVKVRPLVKEPRYDYSKNLDTLLAMGQEGRSRFSNTEKETPVGLTAASLKFDTKYQIITTTSPLDKSVCAQIKNFTLSFGFDDTTVFVASELPRNSCSFREVLEHELKHVNMDRKLVHVYSEKFQPMFFNLVRGIGTIHASSSLDAEKKIRREVSTYVNGLSTSLSKVRFKYQMGVDTKTEYERLRRSCNGAPPRKRQRGRQRI